MYDFWGLRQCLGPAWVVEQEGPTCPMLCFDPQYPTALLSKDLSSDSAAVMLSTRRGRGPGMLTPNAVLCGIEAAAARSRLLLNRSPQTRRKGDSQGLRIAPRRGQVEQSGVPTANLETLCAPEDSSLDLFAPRRVLRLDWPRVGSSCVKVLGFGLLRSGGYAGASIWQAKLLCGSPFQIAAAPRRSAVEVRVSAEGPLPLLLVL